LYNINGDIPSNINFREVINEQTGQLENRIYFLAGGPKREVTIKYINIGANDNQEKVASTPLFQNNSTNVKEKQQLTKEEQLLRERKRCSFNGISSYFLDNNSNRLVFSERSELFYYDDEQIESNVNFYSEFRFKLYLVLLF
jgi:hypothetical protein